MPGESQRQVIDRITLHGMRVMRGLEKTASKSLNAFYNKSLMPYFSGVRNIFAHLTDSREPLNHLNNDINTLERYLDEDGRACLSEIRGLVYAKDNLDYQYTLQALMKGWLFVHIPLTYGLILLACLHLVVTYAFTKGVL